MRKRAGRPERGGARLDPDSAERAGHEGRTGHSGFACPSRLDHRGLLITPVRGGLVRLPQFLSPAPASQVPVSVTGWNCYQPGGGDTFSVLWDSREYPSPICAGGRKNVGLHLLHFPFPLLPHLPAPAGEKERPGLTLNCHLPTYTYSYFSRLVSSFPGRRECNLASVCVAEMFLALDFVVLFSEFGAPITV